MMLLHNELEDIISVPELLDINIFRRLTLKLITKVQRILLRSDYGSAYNLYLKLANLHFGIYFQGRDFATEVIRDSQIGDLAKRRHARLVVTSIFPDSERHVKQHVKAMARESLTKDIMRTMPL